MSSQPNHFPVFEKTKPEPNDSHPLKGLVRRLSETFGPTGSEERVRSLIRDEIKSYADELRVDALGNLIAKKRGNGAAPRPKVMLAAHMDEIGLMVTYIDAQGFCRFGSLGSLQNLALLGQRCVFANGTLGVIGREHKRAKAQEIEYDRLFIDVGTANARVTVGDAACFYGEFVDQGTRLIGKALDDRVGCAILIETLRKLKTTPNDVYFVFTVQEQVGARGAATSTFGLQPDFALAIDVTDTGDTPEAETLDIALGKGPAIKIKDPGVLISPTVRNILVEAARAARVPYQFEVMPHTSSDVTTMQIAREGTHAGALSIPLRYLHTPSEMIDFDDVQNTLKLMVALLSKPLQINTQ